MPKKHNFVTLIALWLKAPPELQERVLVEARRLCQEQRNAKEQRT